MKSFALSVALSFALLFGLVAASAQSLSDYRWQYRLVVMSAPSALHAPAKAQLTAFTEDQTAWELRHLKLVEIYDDQVKVDGQEVTLSSQEVRAQFDISTSFAVLLIGKDGLVKDRSRLVIDPWRFYDLIDTMPMRRREMLAQGEL